VNECWPIKKLGELLKIQNGYAFDSKKFSPIGMPLIRIRDLRGGKSTEICFSGEYEDKYLVKSGDFLIGMDGEFVCHEWKGGPALLNQRVCRLQEFSKALDARFLFYGINKHLKDIEDVTGFTTVKHLSSKQISEIEFPVPPLAAQKRIVAILDEAFAGIAAATANAEKNLANARELFDGHLKALFDKEQATWERKTLRQAALDFGRGKSKHRPRNDPKLYGGKYPFIQTGDVRNCDHVILESTQTYNESGLAQSKLWPKGTICITIAANIAETGILGFDACFPDSVIGMVVDPKQTTNDFVEYLLRSVQAQLKAAGKGSAQDNINLATFEDRAFPFPELEEQARIVETLNQLSSCVRQLEELYGKKLSALAELRQAILQKAFSGELTALPGAEMQEEAA
jgi:type I restriction enzyme S subunit